MFTKILFVIFILSFSITSNAQCLTLNEIDNNSEIEDACALYRDHLKREEIAEAFPYWLKVFKAAPALNGRVTYAFIDGYHICSTMMIIEQEDSKKLIYCVLIAQLIEQQKICYPQLEVPFISEDVKKFCQKER